MFYPKLRNINIHTWRPTFVLLAAPNLTNARGIRLWNASWRNSMIVGNILICVNWKPCGNTSRKGLLANDIYSQSLINPISLYISCSVKLNLMSVRLEQVFLHTRFNGYAAIRHKDFRCRYFILFYRPIITLLFSSLTTSYALKHRDNVKIIKLCGILLLVVRPHITRGGF